MNDPSDLNETPRLLARWRVGDDREAVFRSLFEIHYRRVFEFFSRRGVPPESCRDLSQSAFLHVYRGLDDFRGEASFETWLYQVALNVYRRYLRERSAIKRSAVEVSLEDSGVQADFASPLAPPLEIALTRERWRKVRIAFARLPETMRRCFRLRYEQGLSDREIGRELGLTERSVKTYQYLARRRLRADFRSLFEEPGPGP